MARRSGRGLAADLGRERASRRAAEEARQRLSILAETTLALSSSLDLQATLLGVARLAVTHLADWCVVSVHAGGGGSAVAHGDPERAREAQELARRLEATPGLWSPPEDGLGQRVGDAGRLVTEPALAQLVTSLGFAEAVALPLHARGRVLGTLTVAAALDQHRLDDEQLALAEDFALRAALAIDNALLFETRIERDAHRAPVSELLAYAREQGAVAELSRRALEGRGLAMLAEDACALVEQTLHAEGAVLLHHAEDGLVVAASSGLPPGWERREPIGPDDALEDALDGRRVLHVPVAGSDGTTRHTLAVFARERSFGPHDRDFLSAVAWVLGTASERERTHRRDRLRADRYRLMVERAAGALLMLQEDGTITWASPTAEQLFGCAADELVGQALAVLGAPTEADALQRALGACIADPADPPRLEHRLRTRDRWVETTFTNLLDEPSVGAIVLAARDVTARKRAEELMRHHAHHDALTGLPNRLLFQDRLRQSIRTATRTGSGFALATLDVDHFQQVNDLRGHALGDRLLQALGCRLRDGLRLSDTVARTGGDEFHLLLGGITHAEDALRTTQKLLADVARPFLLGAHRVPITACAGVALFPGDGVTADALLLRADQALARAKEQGRDRCVLGTPEQNERAAERLRLERGLRDALDHGQLRLYYQPLFDVVSGALVAAEALLRWEHPELGVLPASAFVPLAERSSLIVRIGDWALGEVCRQMQAWQAAGDGPPRVAMNISGAHFQEKSLLRRLSQLLGETGIDPGGLELEITESMAMRDTDAAASTMSSMRDLGLHLALDDFGTGYSSLAALKRFPIQTLKIDRSFITDVADGGDDAVLVRAIITMAHTLRLRVVAEGVETAEQLAYLRDESCDTVQGYYLGYPVPAAQLARAS